MLELIRNDHKNLAILIRLLQEKLERVKADKPINYGLMRDVVEYMQEYADRYHHRYEDIIYGYYLRKTGQDENCPVNKLEREHQRIEADTADFKNMIEMILLDSVVPREQFAERLTAYIDQQQRHMDYEDQEILPLLDRELKDEDWKAIEALLPAVESKDGMQATVQRMDPLFGAEVAHRYKDLALRLQRTSRERVD